MGTFALLIENASRDIHTLLALHRVHPQVRTDIQRILGGLLRKRYLDMTVFHSKELTDSPEQVCRSIVNNIVEQTLTTALPAADIRSLERRCMYLEEEKDLLESEVAAAEAKAADTQAVLRDLKEAHDYMLHSYFREVLTLRSRIDDLQRQNRAHRAQATAFAAAAAAAGGGGGGAGTVSGTGPLATSMASQLQQFAFMRHTRFPSGSPRDRGSAAFRDFGGEEVFAGDSAAMSATSLTPSGHDGKAGRAGDSSLTASPTKGFMETLQGAADGDAPPHAAALAQSPAAASTPGKYCASSGGVRGKDRSVRIASPSSRGAGVLMMQTATTMTEVVPTSEVESVDAIFDYEQYVRLLNGERGPWATRFVAVMKEPEGGGRRRRRSLKVRTRSYSDVRLQGSPVGMGSGSGAHAFGDAQSDREQQQQQRDGVKGKGFKFLLRLALEPVQHRLHEELNKLRQAVRTMQKEHARDVQTLGRALLHVQNRSDGLLDFLDTYVRQTQQTMAVLARDSRAQTITDLLSSGALPAEKLETVSTFFSPDTAAAGGAASPPRSRIGSAGAAGPPPPLTQLAAIVGAEVPQASTSPAAARTTTTAAAVGAPSGYSRKEWRLKPDVRRAAETRSAAMQAMDRRLGRADTTPSVPVLSSAPEGAEAAKYYRADLGLPFWSAHPITTQAQEVFAELQEVAKEMRVTRVQQLYAFEEAVAAQAEHARRVRVDSPGAGSRGSSFRRRGDGAALEKDADSYYGPDSDDSTTHPPRRLQEGWRDKKVAEGGEATAADLLRELLHLRMRRACDQIRLARAHETIVQTFYPHLVDPNEEAVMWTKQGKQTLQGGSRKPPKPMDLPPVAFSSAEDVVKHRALQKVRTTTQQRIRTTSQRIAELQRLLELHYAECEVREVVDMTNVEAARRAAAEEASGLYRVNGELRRLSQLWNSPYLNDPSGGHRGVVLLPIGLSSTVDAEGRPSGGAGACVMLGDAAISAAPYASAVPGGGGGGQSSRYRLDESTHQQTGRGDGAAQVRQHGKQEGGQQQQFAMPPNTPSSAVMDYCRAVQLGVPMRGQGGPVYVFQDPSSGAYFVGGADGQPIFTPPPTTTAAGRGGAESREAEVEGEEGEAAASTAQQSAEDGVEGPRPPLTMTRILFPAPRDDTPSTAPIRLAAGESIAAAGGGGERELAGAASSSVYAGPAAPVRSSAAPSSSSAAAAFVQALQPLYLVPMATPLPDEAAAVREGWQAWHQHGHTRQDPIFYSSTAPLPLASSHHRLVPQPTDSVLLRKAEGAGGHANKYMSHPPRVFQPPDEAASMVQVKPLRLQSRGATDSTATYPAEAGTATVSAGGSSPATAPLVAASSSAAAYTGHGGLCSLLSDSTNPGVTASPADTAATPPPPPSFSSAVPSAALLSSSVRPLAAPVEHGRAAPWADSVSAISLDGSLRGAASAPAPPPLTPPSCGDEGAASAKLHPTTAPRQRSAKTDDANSAEAMSLAATAPTTSITAAVLVAKQQRAARLAKEAEQAAAAKAQRQEAWSQQQQRSTGRVPTKKEELMRLPHLAPLSAPPAEMAPASMGPAMLLMPPAANSARLQRQMRPEKYALTPPPPSSSRRAEPAKRSSSAWDLNNDDA